MHKLSRIVYNTSDWQRPTVKGSEHEAEETYSHQFGFGHEEWLFRKEWLIDDRRYSFLQGVNKSHARLIEEGHPFDVTLFTITPDGERRFVASIKDVERLSEEQSKEALDEYKRRGWYDTMKGEITNIQGNPAALGIMNMRGTY
jgi:hypothetical protein